MGYLAPGIWKDDRFLQLDRTQRLIWIFVVTGPHAVGLPGLFELDPLTICGKMAEGLDFAPLAQQAIDRFVTLGLIYLDRVKGIIRIPNAPRHNPPANPNHVRGWFRKWRDITPSQIRLDHIPALREVVEGIANKSSRRDGDGWRTAWASTFGTVVGNDGPVQKDLFTHSVTKDFAKPSRRHEDKGGETEVGMDSSDDHGNLTTLSKRERDSGVEGFHEDFAKRRIQIQISHPDQDPDLVPRSEGSAEGGSNGAVVIPLPAIFAEGTSPSAIVPQEVNQPSERLGGFWRLSEALRASLFKTTPKNATDANLRIVEACLAEFPELDDAAIERVIRSFGDERSDYLCSGANWKPSVFRVQVAKAMKPKKTGAYYGPEEKRTVIREQDPENPEITNARLSRDR
jgi:hypothetical protein